MPNSLKLITRTLIIIALMIVGAIASEYASVIVYIVYFVIGFAAGTMVSPRFTKQKNKFIYLFPILLFVLIGIAPLAYSVFSALPFPWIGTYLSQFTLLSWSLSGLFFAQAFR
ncbi:MAG: hypothetical protein PHQ50_02915 [Eubacteriales bacterium]|nr:hypothetical protein [Eubacteriales bacterium]MDD3350474.1 hypothetical protein [Eubacteriales bacterium]